MSDEENLQKWNQFVKIGNELHLYKGDVRREMACIALQLCKQLIENGFIAASAVRVEIFGPVRTTISEYLDGDKEYIEAAAREYFLLQHAEAKTPMKDITISFTNKNNGVQSGVICTVKVGPETTRYYVKTHQDGPTKDSHKSVGPPDVKELFIYQLLHAIGMGPEVHVIMPIKESRVTVYIATKEVPITLLNDLNKPGRATVDTTALLQLDLISRLLCLNDCTTNSTNCGQVGDKPMILDFRIRTRDHYDQHEFLENFYSGNGVYNYVGFMKSATEQDPDKKLSVLQESLREWNIVEALNKVQGQVNQLVHDYQDRITFWNDLGLYVQGIKETIDILAKAK